MRKLRDLIVRSMGLFNKQRKDRELDEEMESHLQLHIEDNLRLGMTREEARREALIKLGGVESTKEAYRDQRGLPALAILFHDIRYGVRVLCKTPSFTIAAMFTLAVGIGFNSSIFSLIHSMFLRNMPIREPSSVALLFNQDASGPSSVFSHLDYSFYRENARTFAGLVAA